MALHLPVFNVPVCLRLSVAASPPCAICGSFTLAHPPVGEPRLGFNAKDPLLAAPLESNFARVQGMVRQDQPPPLFRRQTVLHERQIQVLVAPIQLVAHNRMPEVRQMNPYLVLAPGVRPHEQERKGLEVARVSQLSASDFGLWTSDFGLLARRRA
jgi:hypothetical protein